MDERPAEDLIDHLARVTTLSPSSAARLVDEVVHYFSESVEAFVRRRHRELQQSGLSNPEIFERLSAELSRRRFTAPALSERQLRRIIYG